MTNGPLTAHDFWQQAEHARDKQLFVELLTLSEQRLDVLPRELAANLAKAEALMGLGRLKSAASFYSAAFGLAREQLPEQPFTQATLVKAQTTLQDLGRLFTERLVGGMQKAGLNNSPEHARVRQAVGMMIGQAQRQPTNEAYTSEPTVLFFPGLETVHFADNGAFPWIDQLAAATEIIDEELSALINAQHPFEPYLQGSPLAPVTYEHNAVGDDGWGAMHLYKVGEPIEEHLKLCPRTMEVLRELPIPDVPGKSPNILFSRLKPGMHIPPHHGQTNARLIGHLALRTPSSGAWLRVGSEKREHHRGEMMLFDDSVEHEAMNESDEDRIVLIFDVWRPELSTEEHRLIGELFSIVQSMD
ncbi:MAG: aspartyl/asparaginyl beta-hydroxylase domain-containing protein [Parvularculaceae bacterium]|nr:aspartyl/asparaginyl beta-hydroxylase domain-containing protein [Parvularculaceae bacterium]